MKPILDHLTTGPNASLSLPAAAVEQEKRKLTAREKRFIKFSSVEYDGQIYMTPQGTLYNIHTYFLYFLRKWFTIDPEKLLLFATILKNLNDFSKF